jgi:nucleotide-binding universal stress UspA family protein
MTQRRIVVGVDGSAVAREALRWTERLASLLDAEIVVVHAVGLLEEHLHPEAVELSRSPFRVIVRDGHPVDVLVDVATELSADLVVVGSRGTGDHPALVLGSTSLHLLQVAPCPVLVVPTHDEGRRHLQLRRLLVAVDGTPESAVALDQACELAAAAGSWIEIVHAVEDVDVFPLGPATAVSSAGEWEAPTVATESLDPLRRQVRRRGIPVHLRVERGSPEYVVTDTAAAVDADLVILASRHVGDPGQGLLDGISRQVVRLAHRPTLVLPVGQSVGSARRRSDSRAA